MRDNGNNGGSANSGSTKQSPRGTLTPCPVVAIGASAGGLEALLSFVGQIPQDSGLAFVIVSHQHPNQQSMLGELLANKTKLPVINIVGGERIEPNLIYVWKGGAFLKVDDHTLMLHAFDEELREAHPECNLRSEGIHQQSSEDAEFRFKRYHPIDRFFRSIASEYHDQAIAIVLSGTGTDGTFGVEAVKAESGMVMVQDPDSAKFSGMPKSALATGLVDYVVLPERMPTQLLEYIRGIAESGKAISSGLTEIILHRVFSFLSLRTGHDFSAYKRSTVQIRIERRLAIHQIKEAEDYLQFLQKNPHEIDLLFKELLISVTSFFRDPAAWEALKSEVIELMTGSRDSSTIFRVWVPGCASGEEPYTIGILISECMEQLNLFTQVQIFATDLDEEAIQRARTGIFGHGIVDDVQPSRLKKYFTFDKGYYRIRKDIRDMVTFAKQDLARDPPFTKMDLITCRNLLIYMKSTLQAKIIPVFHYALNDKGLLMLGTSESINDDDELFELKDKKWRIYRRRDVARVAYLPTPIVGVTAEDQIKVASTHRQFVHTHLARSVERMLLKKFAPVCVVVNQNGDVVYIHGRTGPYLEPPQGQPRYNLLEMARDGLRIELGSMLRQSMSDNSIIMRRLKLSDEGLLESRSPLELAAALQKQNEADLVEITVEKILEPSSLRGLRLVCFRVLVGTAEQAVNSARKQQTLQADPPNQQEIELDQITLLRRELANIKEDKQMLAEEFLAANEELISTNEELQSTNEELQSSNEELETSKEEMQSLNEELVTVNSELESKVYDLSCAFDDMQNLLNSTQIATIFLNSDLTIKRFTDPMSKLIALRNSDIGRPITELATYFSYANLTEDLQQVLKTLESKEVEIKSKTGEWYLLRIMPYRTRNNVIEGLVCTFIDIVNVKISELQRDYFESIVNSFNEPIIVLDQRLDVITANQSFYRVFKMRPAQVENEKLADLSGGQWNIPQLQQLLQTVVEQGEAFTDFEVDTQFVKVGHIKMHLNARRLLGKGDDAVKVLLAIKVFANEDLDKV